MHGGLKAPSVDAPEEILNQQGLELEDKQPSSLVPQRGDSVFYASL